MSALADLFAPPVEEPARRHRYHCGKCGRFVPFATVRKVPPTPSGDEHEHTGQCRAHGWVYVTWGQQ